MHFRPLAAVGAALLVLAACADDQSPVEPPALRVSRAQGADRHIVLFKSEAAAPANFASRVKALGGAVVGTSKAGIGVVSGLSAKAVTQLAKGADILAVQPDFEVRLQPMAKNLLPESVDLTPSSPTNPAGAQLFVFQWHYRQIELDKVWAPGAPVANPFGSSAVKVAILDSGIDPTHDELVGLVDDALSISLVPEVGTAVNPSDLELIEKFFPGARPYTDLNFHGTHVANAVTSNASRVAGMTSRTKVFAVKVIPASGSGSFGAILLGIGYAAAMDADVINMSLGAYWQKGHARTEDGVSPAFGAHSFLNRATKDAHRQGSLVVVAAGNDPINMDFDRDGYNAFCSSLNVVCVSATGPSVGNPGNPAVFPEDTDFDEPAVYSTFGVHDIDVAAPGGNYTLNDKGQLVSGGFTYQACSSTALDPLDKDDPDDPTEPQKYAPLGCVRRSVIGSLGTSMAAPHVSGLAALILAQPGVPRNAPEALKARIIESVDDLAPAGRDPHYGWGRINAARALGVN